MQSFHLPDLIARGGRWREFLRSPFLSVGVYQLKAGQPDEQRPHSEDEVYYVVSGRATFRAGGREEPVRPGSVLYVEREAEHRFTDVVQDLVLLVFFAPPEGSLALREGPG